MPQLLILIYCCKSDNELIIQTENQYEKIDGKRQIVSQTIKTLRKKDRLPIAILDKVYNFNNDIQINYLTGLSKKDGLSDYLLDSFFYDNFGNDTLIKSFVHLENKWHPTQITYKIYSPNKKMCYYMSERPFNKNNYFKMEKYYTYNQDDKILSETEVECRMGGDCDSTFKKRYIYNSSNQLDSTISYIWKFLTGSSNVPVVTLVFLTFIIPLGV